jgi:hypothetical protein
MDTDSILFYSPAKAPSRLMAEAGFDDLLPRCPISDQMTGNQNFQFQGDSHGPEHGPPDAQG